MEIVVLSNKIDDDVNKLIAKFVGTTPSKTHPLAAMSKYEIGDNVYDRCAYCKNTIFLRKHKHVMVFPDMKTFCELCYNNDNDKSEIKRVHERYDIWAVNY